MAFAVWETVYYAVGNVLLRLGTTEHSAKSNFDLSKLQFTKFKDAMQTGYWQPVRFTAGNI